MAHGPQIRDALKPTRGGRGKPRGRSMKRKPEIINEPKEVKFTKHKIASRIEISCYSRTCKNLLDRVELLPCTKCRRCYHAKCCDPPVIFDVAARYPWFCNRCKLCVACDDNSDNRDDQMLICDSCDRAYHMECTKEKYSEVPSGKWFCDDCSTCKSCGIVLTESESNSNNNFSTEGNKLCRICYQIRYSNEDVNNNKRSPTTSKEDNISTQPHRMPKFNEYCCVCSKAIHVIANAGNSKVQCIQCSQGAHTRCSQRQARQIQSNGYEIATWICNICHKLNASFI